MTTAAPTTGAELADALGENGPVLNDKAQAAIKAYVQSQVDTGIQDKIDEGLQAGLADFARHAKVTDGARPNFAATTPVGVNQGQHYNHRSPGAKVDELFVNAGSVNELAGQFLSAIYHGNHTPEAAATQDKLRGIRNAFGSTVPADGGFLIPETLRSELLRVALEKAVVRSRARVIPMDSLTVPFPALDSTSNASTVYGGVAAYWTEEAAALTASSASFSRVKLEAKKLTAYSEVPNELFSDSLISLEAFINTAFPDALAWFEDVAFIRGTGVGEPLGFQNAPAAVSVTKESGQVAATIVWENILGMYQRMLPTSLGSAVWIANINCFKELATMALSVGTGGGPVWMSNGVEGPPMTILGRPVIFTEKMETLGTVGDIVFADLGYYLIGDRMAIQASTSVDYKFANDQTAVRFIERVDGRPWLNSAITPNKGSDTLSPIVRLATRS